MGGRRRRRRGRRGGSAAGSDVPTRRRSGWRSQLESFGGKWTVVIVAVVVGLVVVFAVSVARSGFESSEDPLLGEAIGIGAGGHTEDIAEMEIVEGRPPVGGPHFPTWLDPGVYDEPVGDGFAVHSLEHGIVWISYNANLVSEADVNALEDVADDFGNDVILSPRPANAMAVAAVSWGRLLTLDAVDEDALRAFVTTNRNRSPEPGVR